MKQTKCVGEEQMKGSFLAATAAGKARSHLHKKDQHTPRSSHQFHDVFLQWRSFNMQKKLHLFDFNSELPRRKP